MTFGGVLMRTVFEGSVHVAYSQMYVDSRVDGAAIEGEHWAGQANGLCGAAVEGFLFLVTGMHTGRVGLTIEVHDGPPAVDGRWEDVVEAPFTPLTRAVRLAQWGDADACGFELDPVDHRVRYCAVGMDEASAHGVVSAGEQPVDRYLLQFWPAPAEPDRVVRQTSDRAAYWHRFARQQPPPPTPRERAAAARAAREEEARARAERAREYELRQWAGRLPTERLRRVGGNVHGMRMLDVHLVHAIARVDDATQRLIARWAAHRACAAAGLADVDWIASALAALDAGAPLPAPFDDPGEVWRRLLEDPNVPRTTITLPDGTTHNALRQAFALPALLGAAEPDSLQAALDALYAATVSHGTDHRAFLDEVRDTWPGLGVVPPAPPESPPPHFPFPPPTGDGFADTASGPRTSVAEVRPTASAPDPKTSSTPPRHRPPTTPPVARRSPGLGKGLASLIPASGPRHRPAGAATSMDGDRFVIVAGSSGRPAAAEPAAVHGLAGAPNKGVDPAGDGDGEEEPHDVG
ncbi:hypothetical protein OG948_59935 (plasmid) [Embleya sp. NBC_00888]|uniref:hypothetical protein n=1 Tax=Embleya sp. NBC_00888 TaxID=2975960 RepID=UPI00386DA579|nr:hypothetical protein OG948_59935 [Embleya sp. NBC_00888]